MDEVVSMMSQHGDEAKVLSGGQSLIPLLALRLASPEVVVDINRVTELDYLRDKGGSLQIGALARHRAVELLPTLRERSPMLAEAIELIGHVAIRNRGTVLGSLIHADPAAEWPALALALDAEVDAVGPKGKRTIPADQLFLTYLTTTLEPDEVATEVRFDLPSKRTGSSFQELARRHGDFAVAGAGAVVNLSRKGVIDSARIVVMGVASTAIRVSEAEELVVGESPSDSLFEEASEMVRRAVEPSGDIHGSAEYRRSLVKTLSGRALVAAGRRAQGGGDGGR